MSLLVVAAGLLTFGAALGVGSLATTTTTALGARLGTPWREVVSVVIGLAIESALVQWMAIARVSTPAALVALLVAFVAAGATGAALAWRRRDRSVMPDGWRPRGVAETLPLALGVAALAANLLAAAAPSTKIDELYYHMLVPRRIVEDGALRLYRFPWEAGALPQMTYQIGAAPLHALGLADAWNVVSWALAATLAWFGWRLLLQRASRGGDGGRRRVAAWWVAVASVGLYGVVWHVTGAAHSLGDLALAASLVAVADPESVGDAVAPRDYALAVGALTWAAASSKATLVPLSALLLVWGLARAWRASSGRRRAECIAAGVAPWIVFGLPIVAFTWHLTGTPYGPLLAGAFPGGAYDAAEVGRLLEAARRIGRQLPVAQLATRHSPLLWLGALGALVTFPARRTRRALALVAAAQAAFVFSLVSWDPRFLAGIPFGLALLFAMRWPRAGIVAPRTARAALVASALLVAPWLAAQLVYVRPMLAASLGGAESRERFLARYVALYDDWRRLDALLPRDAVLLDAVGRTSLFYAPRRVLVDARDLAGDEERARTYVLGFSCERGAGPVVYADSSAVVATYRTPGRAVVRRAICVRKLTR